MLEVCQGHLGLGVHATRDLAAGTFILSCEGVYVPYRTRHSLQVDFDSHVDFPEPLRLINHSCDPNCGLILPRGSNHLELYALREILRGEELTTDYCTFENEIHYLTGPCLCGSAICRGRLTGFKDLMPERLAHYGPYIAEYLQPHEAISRAS